MKHSHRLLMRTTLLFLVVLLTPVHSQAANATGSEEDFFCLLKTIDMEGETRDEMLRCITDDGMTYKLDLPREFVKEHPVVDNTYVKIPSGHVIQENEHGIASIVYPNATGIAAVPPRRRHLSVQDRRVGVKTVLVLRVNGADSRLSLSQQQLSARIFGIGDGAPSVNVRSQYSACSFGKFRVVPATGAGITGGVASISIGNVKNKDPFNLENQAIAVAQQKLAISNMEERFDHVMICLPLGTLYGGVRERWFAYGYLNWYRTVYNDKWCGYYSVPMHEIGHNLALQHSSESGQSGYGDQTGIMGYSYANIGAPSMCFNGHKNWLLGWYSDRSISLFPDKDGAWGGRLYAFVDYDRTPLGSYVVIRVRDLYLQYNRARRFNSETQERKNQVTITRGPGDDKQSTLLGGVALGTTEAADNIRVPNFAQTGHSLVIEVCSQQYGPPDFVRLSIYLDNGTQKLTCSGSLALGTKEPTTRPTQSPTSRPTPSPTPRPSTPAPTPRPTPLPTPSTLKPTAAFGFCDDTSAVIRLHPNQATPRFTCLELRQNAALRNSVCVPTHQAYDECRETCGACKDSCRDSTTKTFYVNRMWPDQDCKWLEVRPRWQEFLCHPSHPANRICGETCGSCDVGYSLPKPEYKMGCDDSTTETFSVEELSGRKDCIWLKRNVNWHSRLCIPKHPAYHICEETCRKCSDDCVDDEDATFYVNKKQGVRDCKWLSTAPAHRENLCVDGKSVYTLCKETCNTCSK